MVGALMALHSVKVNGGLGQVVDVALYEAVFAVMESLIPEYSVQGEVRGRTGSSLPGVSPSNTYLCCDGSYVIIGANGDALFQRLMVAIGRQDLAADPALAHNDGRVARNDELDKAIGEWTSQHNIAEVMRQLELAAVPVGRVLPLRTSTMMNIIVRAKCLRNISFPTMGRRSRYQASSPSLQVALVKPAGWVRNWVSIRRKFLVH
jgi:crotonobetainyl-CoA:carnitine CoA-transferase CaiB-like acyl-CoA transferase